MNRPRPQQRPHRLDKDGSHRKRKRQPDKEKMLCTENQIRGSQSFTFFSFQAPPSSHPSTPLLQLNVLLLLVSLLIMRSTAVLSYHLRLLSSLICVTVGRRTSSFVGGPLGRVCPWVVTPAFIMVSPAQRTSMS